ncbi:hypothetical protein CIB95_07625 [Lottiidibacillus patelloidae]|uniref:UPF0398 protein CIB95_07625 n=1 Tax=Lottiidibacillus patelloidae TaxID=2670334 RepID=A0A263BUF9_9BACI|nr:DUF1273 domain-containing protein [Lottiidibacillus patelloidae]OZM57325.1 hypothetical protein CIB95_07625 [Lottiidibacillus patelloidae]
MKVVLVTGYKAHELGIFDNKHPGVRIIKQVVKTKLISLIEEGLEWVIISGQPGVEIWAGECVVELKEKYENLKLGVLTPFFNQEERWKDDAKERYNQLLLEADFVDSISKKPYEDPSQLRIKNQYLVSKTDGLVILYDEDKPGSPSYYLTEAQKRYENDENYPILYITPYDIESAAELENENDPNYWVQ